MLGRICLAVVLAGSGPPPGGADAPEERPLTGIGVERVHAEGITGLGVTVAVVDGPAAPGPEVLEGADGHRRLLAVFDAVTGSVLEPVARPAPGLESRPTSHLLDLMLSSRRDAAGRFEGVAPNADLVLVRALDAAGAGRPADVARGVDWVVANRDRYGIRVLCLPLAVVPERSSPEGPLRRSVLEAWTSGIVVVAAAGNGGPAPATVASPGDLPHVVTVGAATTTAGGWEVAAYSASGTTRGGFVKPEVVAPAGFGEPLASPPVDGRIRRAVGGTSNSAAVVAGVAALVLEAWPWLTPVEVKDRLVLFARPLAEPIGEVRSIHRQGAGVVDAHAAVEGLSLPVPADEQAARGLVWSDSALSGLTWSDRSLNGMVWSDSALHGLTWSDGAFAGAAGSDRAARGLTWSD